MLDFLFAELGNVRRQFGILAPELIELLLVVAVDLGLDRVGAGKRCFLRHQRGRRTEREPGNVPQGLEQGRANATLDHQMVEAVQVPLFLRRHAGHQLRFRTIGPQHRKLARIDAGGAIFACLVDPTGASPKQTFVLDLMQFAETEQLAIARSLPLVEAAAEIFRRTLPGELTVKLQQKNLGIDYRTLDRAVAKGGDIKYIDFRKDWSPHFKRLCIMPDGRLVEPGGLEEFARLHGITQAQAKTLVEQGGILDVGGEVLACQIVNGQPAVARFNAKNYAKAKELAASKGMHLMDALSEVGYNDPAMMRGLARKELTGGR